MGGSPYDVFEGIRMQTTTISLALAVGMAALLVQQSANFKITPTKKNDTVTVQADKDKAVFVVKSPSGIGKAVIDRQQDKWPKSVIVRLHLKGLESLEAANGNVTLHAAVSVKDSKPSIRLWKDGQEKAGLDKNSPLWTPISILGVDGKPATQLPLKDGYFELQLPAAFFEGNPQTITLSWIDFYR